MGDRSAEGRTSFHWGKAVSQDPAVRCWTEVDLNGARLPLSKLLFLSILLNLSSEHDPPWSRAETFRSSSGQKSNSLALPGKYRWTPEATQLGEVQGSQTGKVRWLLEPRKGLWNSDLTGPGVSMGPSLCTFYIIRLTLCHKKPGSVYVLWRGLCD